jgi:hypothetical protein
MRAGSGTRARNDVGDAVAIDITRRHTHTAGERGWVGKEREISRRIEFFHLRRQSVVWSSENRPRNKLGGTDTRRQQACQRDTVMSDDS